MDIIFMYTSHMSVERKETPHTLNHRDRSLLIGGSIDLGYVDTVRLSRGAHHNVYKYTPLGEPEKVVKVPNFSRLGLHHSFEDVTRDAALISSYFSGIAIPCEIRQVGSSYCVIMDFVQGRVLSTQDLPRGNAAAQNMLRA